jgi:tRNA-Thr(GGU) m(6)t(6)A37 methyltransferase TsaA
MVRLSEVRPGETVVETPALSDAGLYFIGRIHTPWTDRMTCPRQGRQDGPTCHIEVFEPWSLGLDGVAMYERLEVLYWLHLSRRDIIRQTPGQDGTFRGVFSLRSPVRPDPVGTQLVRLLKVDGSTLFVRGLDCVDGTPLIDLKPDRCLFTPLAPRLPGDNDVGDGA